MVDLPVMMRSLSSAIDVVKQVHNAGVAISDAELKQRLADVMSSLADTKLGLLEAQDQLRQKDAEIERLRKAFQRKSEELVECAGLFYRKGQGGNPVGRPFCPRCLEKDGFLIGMQNPVGRMTRGDSVCPQCNVQINCSTFMESSG